LTSPDFSNPPSPFPFLIKGHSVGIPPRSYLTLPNLRCRPPLKAFFLLRPLLFDFHRMPRLFPLLWRDPPPLLITVREGIPTVFSSVTTPPPPLANSSEVPLNFLSSLPDLSRVLSPPFLLLTYYVLLAGPVRGFYERNFPPPFLTVFHTRSPLECNHVTLQSDRPFPPACWFSFKLADP